MVDNTIAMQVRPFQMPDLGQIYGNIQNIQMNRMRMAEAQETAQERNALRGLLSSGVDLNTPEGMARLRQAAPMLAPQFEQAASQRAYQRAQTEAAVTRTQAARIDMYRNELGGINAQEPWTAWRTRVLQEFPQYATSIPERFSPEARLRVAGGAAEIVRGATAGGERAQAQSAREQRIADTMATFGVDRATALGLVDNIITVVPGSAGEPPVLVNKLTNEIVTPRMGAARPAAAPTAPTAPEAPAIDLRRPQAAAPAAPTNMMLSGATGAPAPVSAPATDSVEDFYAGRRQRQVQQAGQIAESEARGRVAAPPAPRQDFRYTPDFQGVEPIPGSVAAREAADREKAARVRRETEQQTGGTVIRAIDDAEKTIRTAVLPTTGFFAERLSGMGGTAARNLRADLETIRSNIGFDQLNQMRQASPTGGALGNVSNQEIAYLQAVMGSVDQSQSEAQLRRNLSRLREAYLEIVNYGLGNRPPVEIPGPGGRGTAEPPREGMPDARRPAAGAAPAAPGEIRLPSGVTIRPIQ